jgi:general secretion pathway protein E
MTPTAISKALTDELAALADGNDAPAVAVVDRLLVAAREAGASDLHVDPEPDRYVIRLRLDGVLHQAATLWRRQAPTLVARLKVLADLPTYVTDVAQDGRIPASRVRAQGDLRLAVLPTIHGEKAVVRLFDPGASSRALGELGLPEATAQALTQASLSPRGVVVLCGPAGSGKSTTIHAALQTILERSGGARSIVGIEDPVERVIPGITQAQVDAAAGFGFAEALRAFLRQDPQVIYVGECRDAATASVAIQAGLTGHLVITTLHAGSREQVFTRLLEMGIEPHLVTSAVSLVLAQRLVRRLCSDCAQPDTARALPALRDGVLGEDVVPLRAVGCSACQHTGYRGRIPLAEHGTLSEGLRRAVLDRADEETLGAALRASEPQTLRDHALSLVAQGETSLAELERVLGVLTA